MFPQQSRDWLLFLAAYPQDGYMNIDKGFVMTFRPSTPAVQNFYPAVLQYLQNRAEEFSSISSERRMELEKVADYIRACQGKSQPAKLIFICTHNSRRSQFAQIWARIAARYNCLNAEWNAVETFSGGTEATAFNPRAVAALERCGLRITVDERNSPNPKYSVAESDSTAQQLCFSKIYDSAPNPTKGYCAVMTCSQADESCPLVTGCDLRVAIRYEDPKVADDTEHEAERYDERSAQICREMLYLMARVQILDNQ